MNFSIFFSDNPVQVAREIHRTLKPGGTALFAYRKHPALFDIIFDVQDLVQPANPNPCSNVRKMGEKRYA